ncbi:golgin subfamily A member 6-like protein 22 [Fundulus heteroclitus]|uniref:golgin subfamily A member 6-like protein 22 n=1 Tax=Fundulus heteroclitus TaxID=8078 RepID=UPI00165BB574|nr:golgin subfamily A member 6-like protein 22 [Fundulus heteroclitus]
MTPPKSPAICPICEYQFNYLGKHLANQHSILNNQEKIILINYASGRVNVRHLPCPVQGCGYSSTRLDRHLETGHPELDEGELKEIIKNIKKQVSFDSLRALRATDPSPPVISNLDLGQDEDEQVMDVSEPVAPSCSTCKKIAADNRDLWRKLRNKRRWIEKAKAKINALEEALQKATAGESGKAEPGPSGQLDLPEDEESSSSSEEPPKKWTTISVVSEVEKTIVRYEENARRLESCWRPQIKTTRIDLQKPHVSMEEEASSIQQLCNQRRRSSHDQEEAEPQWSEEEQMEPEPPLIKEEHVEPESSWVKEEQIEPETQIEEQENPECPRIKEEKEICDSSRLKHEQQDTENLATRREQEDV